MDDILRIAQARQEIESFPSLITEVGALKYLVHRQQLFTEFLADTVGLHLSGIDFLDEELRALYDLSMERPAIQLAKIAALTKILLSFDDRTMRRMDTVTGEKNSWRHLIMFAEGVEDAVDQREDLRANPGVYKLKHDLNRALHHFKLHAKLAIALLDPEQNPHDLLDQICARAAKATVPYSHSPAEIRKALAHLLEEVTRKRLQVSSRTT